MSESKSGLVSFGNISFHVPFIPNPQITKNLKLDKNK